MNIILDPLVSKFDTQVQADAYDTWFQTKVAQALDDVRPLIPHDEVVRKMQMRFETLRQSQNS